jgi:hypothetical protein
LGFRTLMTQSLSFPLPLSSAGLLKSIQSLLTDQKTRRDLRKQMMGNLSSSYGMRNVMGRFWD